MEEAFYDIEKAIDYAFMERKFVMNFYSYLKVKNARRIDAQTFKESLTARNIQNLAEELHLYIDGGQTNNAKMMREAYGHISKPEARKIENYLLKLRTDCDQYIKDKNAKKGRRSTK